jgi:hypothetical protein
VSPAAVHYVARSSAFEVAAALARGKMSDDEIARWDAELRKAWSEMGPHEQREHLQPGAPSSHVRALIAWIDEKHAPIWLRSPRPL